MSEYHPLRLTRFDFDVADFLSSPDVASMTAREVGQYILLLCAAWAAGNGATLPNDPKILAKLARAPRGVSPKVMAKFCLSKTTNGVLVRHNPRLSKEWEFALDRAQRRSEKAQKAAKSGWEQRARSMLGARSEQDSKHAQAMLKDASVSVPVSVPVIKDKSKSSCPPPADEASLSDSHSAPTEPAVSVPGMELAVLLRQRRLENSPKAKITEKQVCEWGREADLMLRLDHRTPEEITSVIEWSQGDNFWKTNILSMGKLREKFDQLMLKRNAEKGASNANANRKPINAVNSRRGTNFSAGRTVLPEL